MATSGLLSTTAWKGKNGTRYLELSWERTSFDVAAQTSTIKWTLTSRGTYTGYVMTAPITVVIDGETVYQTETRTKLYTNTTMKSGTKTIKHNTDGTKTFTASVNAAIYYTSINATGSSNFTLDLVGMATITKAPNFTDEDNPTIEYYNPVGNAISSLQAAISLTGAEPNIEYREIEINGSSYTFTLTDYERAILCSATQGSNSRKVRFYLRNVVDGNIYFSWKEVVFTVVNANPIVEATAVDAKTSTIELTGDNTTLIRYHSDCVASIATQAQKQATIENYYIEHNGEKRTAEYALYENVEGNVFTFVAVDSRGNTTSKTIVANMIDYVKPTANIDTSQQMDTNGNYMLNVSGNYYNDTFGYTDAAAANMLTVAYRYKAQGGEYSGWTAMENTLDGNTYTAAVNITGLDYRTAYVFQCRAIDKLNDVYSAEITVRSLPVFHWSDNDFTFEVPVNFNAGANGIENGGTIDNISGDLTISGDLEVGGIMYLGGYPLINYNTTTISGDWTPTLTTAAAVSSYTLQQGWYSRVGDTISIGWQIKAVINEGYSSTAIAISGCPITPKYAAFGGGIAHNVYLTAGFCFEGWCIGTDGKITMRGQPCNNTTAGNLQINSTAYYPTGSNTTITLAGSITFRAGADG